MKIIECEQGTEEWHACRNGRLTGSNAQCIASNGKGLETYCYQILAEKYSNNRDHYTNEDMVRGNELEAQARMTYSIMTGNEVQQVGFLELDELSGCSPDGLVNEDGGLEIKCPTDVVYFKLLLSNKFDTKYFWQCQMFLLVSGRKWIDLVAYNPNFEKSIIIQRIEKDLASQEKLIIGLEKGRTLIRDLEAKFKNLN